MTAGEIGKKPHRSIVSLRQWRRAASPKTFLYMYLSPFDIKSYSQTSIVRYTSRGNYCVYCVCVASSAAAWIERRLLFMMWFKSPAPDQIQNMCIPSTQCLNTKESKLLLLLEAQQLFKTARHFIWMKNKGKGGLKGGRIKYKWRALVTSGSPSCYRRHV